MFGSQLPQIYDEMPIASMALDKDMNFIRANRAYCRAVRRTPEQMLNRYVFDVFPDAPERVELAKAFFRKTLDGEISITEKQPYKLELPDKSVEDRFWDVENHPLRDDTGNVIGLVQYCHDVTAQEQLRLERDIVSRELDHRVKNMLAVIQSVAFQTGRFTNNKQAFLTDFSGRLAAISQNYNDMVKSNWQGLSLSEIAASGLAMHLDPAQAHVSINGPPLQLTVKATKDISMLLHELLTNAAKYGFLTSEHGRLDINWTVEAGQIIFNWNESGLSGIKPPENIGYGFKLFELMPNIKAKSQFEDDGLKLQFSIPLETVTDRPAH